MAAEPGPFAHHLIEQGEVREAYRVGAAPSLAAEVQPDQHRDGQQPEQEQG